MLGFGRVIPRADPTLAAVGHRRRAGLAAWVEVGPVEADTVVADTVVDDSVVGEVVGAVDDDGVLEPPQALRVATKTPAISAKPRGLRWDTSNGSLPEPQAQRNMDSLPPATSRSSGDAR
jgi:hypothetical protein